MSHSFYKNYPNRKDHRSKYYDTRRFDSSCKSHGSCKYCESSRFYQQNKEKDKTDSKLKDYFASLV